MEIFSPPNIILVNTKKLQEELKNKSFNNERYEKALK